MTERATVGAVQDLMQGARCLLLDFDGPICDIFAGLPASDIAAKLRQTLNLALVGKPLPPELHEQDDPLEIFRFSAQLDEPLNRVISRELTDLELIATATARPTPGAVELIRRAREVGKSLAVVSNNSAAAVAAYLRAVNVLSAIDHIAARVDPDPRLMKPHPHLVRQALAHLDVEPSQAILVGDSITDMEVCRSTGVLAVGYANRQGKAERLAAAGADLVVTSMQELTVAL